MVDRYVFRGIYLLVLFLAYFLFVYKILSPNQTFIFLFAVAGAYTVMESMLQIKTDSILKRHKILFTVPPLIATILLAIFLSIFSTNIFFTYLILVVPAFSIALSVSITDWNNKRKQNKIFHGLL